MHREYHRWYSGRLGRDMELLIFGHAGAKVLVFPTRDGRFHEYENLRMVDALRHKLDAGQLQLWCIDSIDWESLYCFWCHPADRIRRHGAFEEYILNEVMPLMQQKNPHPCTISHGLSLGAFHAANIAFRHPHLFQKLVAFSGRYDLTLNVEHFRICSTAGVTRTSTIIRRPYTSRVWAAPGGSIISGAWTWCSLSAKKIPSWTTTAG
jgi:esterase/lipase superfamily enzyme